MYWKVVQWFVNMAETNQSFYLDTETLDALRLEAQAISPKEAQEFREVVDEAYELFLKKFNKLFTQREVIPPETMKERFVLVDPDTMKVFLETWKTTHDREYDDHDVMEHITKPFVRFLQNNGSSMKPTKEAFLEWLKSLPAETRTQVEDIISYESEEAGFTYVPEGETGTFKAYHREGHFIVGIPIDLWESLNSENRIELVDQHQDEESARKFVRRATWLNLVLHEITHLYQDDTDSEVPLWLKELQAYWVGRQLVDPESQLHLPDFDKRADFFQTLLYQYPDLHEVILELNRGKNRHTLYRIRQLVSEDQIKELFPDYRST